MGKKEKRIPLRQETYSEPLLPPLPPLWPKFILPLCLICLLLGGLVFGYWKYKYEPALQEQIELAAAIAIAEPYEGELVAGLEREGECYRVSFQLSETRDNLCVAPNLWGVQEVGAPFDLTPLREKLLP